MDFSLSGTLFKAQDQGDLFDLGALFEVKARFYDHGSLFEELGQTFSFWGGFLPKTNPIFDYLKGRCFLKDRVQDFLSVQFFYSDHFSFSASSVYFLAPKKDQYQVLLLLIKDQEPLYSLSKPLLIKIKINPSVTKNLSERKTS